MTTPQSDPAKARLRAHSTVLVPLAPEHSAGLRGLELSEELAFRWRHGGAHPTPEQYAASLWTDVLCNFLVFDEERQSAPLGIISAYQADHSNGHCRVAAARFGWGASDGRHVIRGVSLILDYLFQGWPFRKVYFEVPEYNISQLSSGTGTWFVEEARLPDYLFLDNRYWSMIFLAVTREGWATERERLARFIYGTEPTSGADTPEP